MLSIFLLFLFFSFFFPFLKDITAPRQRGLARRVTQGRYSLYYQTKRRNNLMFCGSNTKQFLRKAKTDWRSSALKDPKARVGKNSAEDAAATR